MEGGNGDVNGYSLRILVLVAVLSGGGSAGIGSLSGAFRADPFTGAQAMQMEARIMLKIEKEIANIRHAMPPVNTKRRVRALERHLERSSEFESPTTDW